MSDQPLTDADLAAIEARCEAATRGPWCYDGQHDEITAPYSTYSNEQYWLIVSEGHTAGIDGAQDEFGHRFNPNFAFVAHARDDVPDLLAALRQARAENQALREALTRAVEAAATGNVHTGRVCILTCEQAGDCRGQVSDVMTCPRATRALAGQKGQR